MVISSIQEQFLWFVLYFVDVNDAGKSVFSVKFMSSGRTFTMHNLCYQGRKGLTFLSEFVRNKIKIV